jgi:hypothetical protein
MVVFVSSWAKRMHQPGKINIVIILTILSIFLINSHILINNGYENFDLKLNNVTKKNETIRSVVCYRTRTDPKYIFPKWESVHLLLYNAIRKLIIINFFFRVNTMLICKFTLF